MASSTFFSEQLGEEYGQLAAKYELPPGSTAERLDESMVESEPADVASDKRAEDSRQRFRPRVFAGVVVVALFALLAFNISRNVLRSSARESIKEENSSSEAQTAVYEILAWVSQSKAPKQAIDMHALLREELLRKPGFPDIRKYVPDDNRFKADFVSQDLNVSVSVVLFHLTPSWNGRAAAAELSKTLLPELNAAEKDFLSGFMPVFQRSLRFGEGLGGTGLVTITVRRSPRKLDELDVEKVGLDPEIAARYAEWQKKQKQKGL
ncbi:hypothetical protein Esti_002669 [Eimeria stiedai]